MLIFVVKNVGVRGVGNFGFGSGLNMFFFGILNGGVIDYGDVWFYKFVRVEDNNLIIVGIVGIYGISVI